MKMKTIRNSILCFSALFLTASLLDGQELSKYRGSVDQILFSFSNSELYKISVTYDQSSTEGLTTADMVKSISAKYGPATSVASEIDPVMNALYNMNQGALASWQDSQYSFDLVRTPLSNHFGLVIYSKRVNAEAELAIARSAPSLVLRWEY
jgi:hypothetical protein